MTNRTITAEANLTLIGTQDMQQAYFDVLAAHHIKDISDSAQNAKEITSLVKGVRNILALVDDITSLPRAINMVRDNLSGYNQVIRSTVESHKRSEIDDVKFDTEGGNPQPERAMMEILMNAGEAVVSGLKRNMRGRAEEANTLIGAEALERDTVTSLERHIRRGIRASRVMGVFVDFETGKKAEEKGKFTIEDTANSIEPAAIVELSGSDTAKLSSQIYLLERSRDDFAQEGMLIQVDTGRNDLNPLEEDFVPEVIYRKTDGASEKYDPFLSEVSETTELVFDMNDIVGENGDFVATQKMLEFLIRNGIPGATIVDGKLRLSYIPQYEDVELDMTQDRQRQLYENWKQRAYKAITSASGGTEEAVESLVGRLASEGKLVANRRILVNYYEDVSGNRGKRGINGEIVEPAEIRSDLGDPSLESVSATRKIEQAQNLARLIQNKLNL